MGEGAIETPLVIMGYKAPLLSPNLKVCFDMSIDMVTFSGHAHSCGDNSRSEEVEDPKYTYVDFFNKKN